MKVIDDSRNRVVCLSQDPKTIFSYGLQVKELITGLPQYQFHVISSQYISGNPYSTTLTDKTGKPITSYVTWAFESEEKKCTSTLNNVIKHTNPLCVFSMGDIHHYNQIPIGKRLQNPWVSWFPWDNHDIESLLRLKNTIEEPDVKITMNKFSFDLLKQYQVDVDGMIYNIVDTNVFKPLTTKELNKQKLEKLNPYIKNKKILLFVGRPNWRKNLEFLIMAFKEITRIRDDVLLYLHVDFNDEGVFDKPNIHKLIHGGGLAKKIIYTEKNKWTQGIEAEFLNRLYNVVDLYVSPHGGEGFGLPFCEAMACGVPFVATDCTSMPEFAEDGKRGLLAKVATSKLEKGVYRPWVDIKDFVDKILYLLDNDEERKKMGRRGIYWVRKNCSKTKIASQWQQVFEKLNVPICEVEEPTILEWSDKYVPQYTTIGE